MLMTDLIQKKKNGEPLTRRELSFLVRGVTDGSIPDYQLSALCMAILFKGMKDREIADLTDEMAHSGDMIDLSEFGTLSVDKHSTGGVGDKTTLILAPLVAACGAKVAKMSGRGLGHTGGTVDKLESIPGYRTELPEEDFRRIAREVGVCVIGQSGELAPADKKLYALRDVTGTVDSIPLIVSSIMSKKLAAGAHSIVLDVTVGSGAFMKTVPDAVELAQKMVTIGRACGRNMSALITDMSEPLGFAIGNAMEVQEALAVLRGEEIEDLKEVCLALAGEMLSLSLQMTPEEGRKLAEETLASGAAYKKMKQWVAAQGGDERYIREPERFPAAAYSREILAKEEGYIAAMDTEAIGRAACQLGAGRKTKADVIDMAAGIRLCKKLGDHVEKGDVLAVLYTEREETLYEAVRLYKQALTFSPDPVKKPPLVHRIIR
ncbi:MAG: pyrimidine-nucleoside phosphorylase [Lachnospiraceae bacterium]|nr:pyrimidine-nucleoside phosphorylase [Lachnospiraceae bacterium]